MNTIPVFLTQETCVNLLHKYYKLNQMFGLQPKCDGYQIKYHQYNTECITNYSDKYTETTN